MRPMQIIAEELKKSGLAIAESDAEVLIKTIFEKIAPRLAMEGEGTVKTIFTALLVFNPMIEKMLLEMAEKIDPNT